MTGLRQIYVCERCGNAVEVLGTGDGELVCCGVPMTLQRENTVDASKEKHIPVVSADGGKLTVQVGSVLHPMEAAHYIEWVEVEEGNKLKRAALKPGDEPKAVFCTKGGKYSVRIYCNLHGLWKA
ncbi:MAG: desulfoferrodoxin [Planctomycetaceae bacterium]|nr:desulfoferrodoxin [Planctomycetaceae bacterium]